MAMSYESVLPLPHRVIEAAQVEEIKNSIDAGTFEKNAVILRPSAEASGVCESDKIGWLMAYEQFLMLFGALLSPSLNDSAATFEKLAAELPRQTLQGIATKFFVLAKIDQDKLEELQKECVVLRKQLAALENTPIRRKTAASHSVLSRVRPVEVSIEAREAAPGRDFVDYVRASSSQDRSESVEAVPDEAMHTARARSTTRHSSNAPSSARNVRPSQQKNLARAQQPEREAPQMVTASPVQPALSHRMPRSSRRETRKAHRESTTSAAIEQSSPPRLSQQYYRRSESLSASHSTDYDITPSHFHARCKSRPIDEGHARGRCCKQPIDMARIDAMHKGLSPNGTRRTNCGHSQCRTAPSRKMCIDDDGEELHVWCRRKYGEKISPPTLDLSTFLKKGRKAGIGPVGGLHPTPFDSSPEVPPLFSIPGIGESEKVKHSKKSAAEIKAVVDRMHAKSREIAERRRKCQAEKSRRELDQIQSSCPFRPVSHSRAPSGTEGILRGATAIHENLYEEFRRMQIRRERRRKWAAELYEPNLTFRPDLSQSQRSLALSQHQSSDTRQDFSAMCLARSAEGSRAPVLEARQKYGTNHAFPQIPGALTCTGQNDASLHHADTIMFLRAASSDPPVPVAPIPLPDNKGVSISPSRSRKGSRNSANETEESRVDVALAAITEETASSR